MALTPAELMAKLFPTPMEQTPEQRFGWGVPPAEDYPPLPLLVSNFVPIVPRIIRGDGSSPRFT